MKDFEIEKTIANTKQVSIYYRLKNECNLSPVKMDLLS